MPKTQLDADAPIKPARRSLAKPLGPNKNGGSKMQQQEYSRYDHLFPRRNDSLILSDGCTLCSKRGLGFVGRDIIWGNGSRTSKLMLVGKDSAGAQPKEPLWRGSKCTGIPLTNRKTGGKLRILLLKANVDPFSVFMTNTVKCNVGYDECGLTYAKLVPACIQHLMREIAIVQPKILIALGTDAAKHVWQLWHDHKTFSLTGLDETEMLRDYPPYRSAINDGTGKSVQEGTLEVFSMKHPSYVEGGREQAYVANLKVIVSRLT
jgi:uracil-DNA glycosylase family 4